MNLFSFSGKSCHSSKAKNVKEKKGERSKSTSNSGARKTNSSATVDSEEETIGQVQDKPAFNSSKYCDKVNPSIVRLIKTDRLIPAEMSALSKDFENLILYSASKQTWAKHCSAWKLYNEFCISFGTTFKLPIPVEFIRAFVTWAISVKKLKDSTVRSYISSLNIAHTLSNVNSRNLNSDPCVKMALKGANNLQALTSPVKPDRLPMNVFLLEVLSDRIFKLNWTPFSKQVFWTACTLCFFTSCRMGELVALNEKDFDPTTTLTWGNVSFDGNKEIVIFVPYTKTTGFKGKVLDVFYMEGNNLCPASALKKLRSMVQKENIFSLDKPVFSFLSGKHLTKNQINNWLAQLLNDFTDPHHKITGHSFRAGIPSCLACFPDRDTVDSIKEWGQWYSDSYTSYAKHEREKRRAIFLKIVSCLYRC